MLHFGKSQTSLCSLLLSSVSSLIVENIQATSKGSDQTARMHRLIGAFAGRTYHAVGNLMSWYMSVFCFLRLIFSSSENKGRKMFSKFLFSFLRLTPAN